MVVRLGRVASWVVLGLACLACGDDAEGGGGETRSGSCEVAGRETDFCRLRVQRYLACDAVTDSEQTVLARCRADWGEYTNRVAPCFVAELSECLTSSCDSDDACYTDAMVTYDPSLVDAELYWECREGDEEAGCDDLARGFLLECLTRARACDGSENLCVGAAVMKPAYRDQAEACLARPCEEFDACLYVAMGRSPASRAED